MLSKNNKPRKLGIAILGLTSYACEQIIPALKKTQNGYLAGLVSNDMPKAREWAKLYNVPIKNIYNYQNFEEVTNNPNIDIIYVILPPALHKEYVIRAAKAGKHVICEKPMAINSADCQEMIAECEKANRLLSIGYRMHFEPHHQYIMDLEKKGLGKMIKFEAAFGGFFTSDPNAWRLIKALAGGGALMDLGIYTIQAARYTTGLEPIAVTATQQKLKPELFIEVDETVFFELEFSTGFKANCKCSYNAEYSYIHIETEKGPIKIEPAFLYTGIYGTTPDGVMDMPQVNQQALQIDDFITCISQNKKSSVSGEEGLKDIKIIEAIYRALASGKREVIA